MLSGTEFLVPSFEFRVWGFGHGDKGEDLGSELRVQVSGFRVWGKGLGSRFQSLGCEF